ncbi:MAG: SDR family oxidoreductase [Methanoregula sp.]|nr:MAG: SDR family oxidoreductase [Methanoregula sp.]
MIKILITGSNGFLGSNLVSYFSQKSNYRVFSTSQKRSVDPELNDFIQGNLLDISFVNHLFSTVQPDIVINTVSLVNVDQCEENPDLANAVTVVTAENIAQASDRYRCRLVYISTDHLFDGKKSMYTEGDIPAPVNIYGKTKLLAERRTLKHVADTVIVRTNFFGWSPPEHPPTFGEWVYNNLKEKKPMTLFTDYYFTPIEVTYLAEAIETVATSSFSGIINIAGSERCSKYEFGIALAEECGFDSGPITPATIESDSFKAPRQQDLSLSTEKFRKLFNKELFALRQSIKKFCRDRENKDMQNNKL